MLSISERIVNTDHMELVNVNIYTFPYGRIIGSPIENKVSSLSTKT